MSSGFHCIIVVTVQSFFVKRKLEKYSMNDVLASSCDTPEAKWRNGLQFCWEKTLKNEKLDSAVTTKNHVLVAAKKKKKNHGKARVLTSDIMSILYTLAA